MTLGVSPPIYTSPDGVVYSAEDVVRVLTPLSSTNRLDRIQSVLSRRLTSVSLGVEDLHHEHNGAACLRTAEGLGIHHIYAAEIRNTYPLPNSEASSAKETRRIPRGISMHAHRWIELTTFRGNQNTHAGVEMVRAAQSNGYQVYGAGPRGQFELLELPMDKPIMVLFGNEAQGLQAETMAACDGVFRIPMFGFTESFNISVSVGMVLEQLGARRRAQLSEIGINGELSSDEQLRLTAEWLARDMKRVDLILHRQLG